MIVYNLNNFFLTINPKSYRENIPMILIKLKQMYTHKTTFVSKWFFFYFHSKHIRTTHTHTFRVLVFFCLIISMKNDCVSTRIFFDDFVDEFDKILPVIEIYILKKNSRCQEIILKQIQPPPPPPTTATTTTIKNK